MPSIAFATLGCKVNQADTASLMELFRRAGFFVVPFAQPADVYVINTCVVTNMGQRKSRQFIQRAVRQAPAALIVVCGCYPQVAPDEVRALPGVDVIIGTQERAKAVALVEEALAAKKEAVLDGVRPFDSTTVFDELAAGADDRHTRAFLKIQEGCDQFCTYCLIPYARGPLRSRPLSGIKEEVERLVAAGFKEVVLIGIHLGAYGRESGSTLAAAAAAALSVPNLVRLRLGSLESIEVEDDLLQLMKKDSRFCRHLHLPLQAGSDAVLKAMGRPYRREEFAALLAKIRDRIPGINITTDIIVGFPGETEENFAESCDFARACAFGKLHIFPYSRRKGTPAAALPNQLTAAVKAERARKLGLIDKELQRTALEKAVGSCVEVLWEEEAGPGRMEGLSGSYFRVQAEGGRELANKLSKVRITAASQELLLGEIIK